VVLVPASQEEMSKEKAKDFWEMTAEELAAATREFDREHVAETFRDMSAAEEKAWRATIGKKRRANPTGADVVKVVPLQIEAGLLKRADALTKKRGVSRAQLVADGLEELLARAKA
jgi:hypothetical protein